MNIRPPIQLSTLPPDTESNPHTTPTHTEWTPLQVEDAAAQLLDDNLAMTQAMAFSPFKAPFAERLAKWEAQLRLVSDTIDAWLAVQRGWMYLEPIFSSADIMEQLPVEGKRFSAVDRTWRRTMAAAQRAPQARTRPGFACPLAACAERSTPALSHQMLSSNKAVQLIHAG